MKKKKKQKHNLFFHTIFITVIRKWFRRNIIFIFFFVKDFISLAFAIWSRSFLDRFNFFCSKNRRFFIFSFFFRFFFRLFFRRDRFLRVSFDFRHVNEIRNFVVIRSTIVRIFFIYFVNETKSITLCSLAKSKRRCLNEFIQRQRASRIFSIIHNLCCAKRATRIFL